MKQVARRTGEEALFATCFTLVSCLAYSYTLKMEAICFSETSVDSQWTTWYYILEEITLHNHVCENVKSCEGVRNFLCVYLQTNLLPSHPVMGLQRSLYFSEQVSISID
jgi:hypothetical protein